jgi:Protein of unknown function (DUF3237)
VPPLYVVGQTPNAFRRIGVITGGSFEGERLSGEVLSGGNDWQNVRPDSCTKLDVRLLLKTTDDALIVMTYHVLRCGPPAVMQALDRGETVDPTSYYFRLSGLFETGAPAIRLVEPDHRHRYRQSCSRWTDLQSSKCYDTGGGACGRQRLNSYPVQE